MQKSKTILRKPVVSGAVITLLIFIPVACFSYAFFLQKTGQLDKHQKEVKAATIANDLAKKHTEILSSVKEQVQLPTNETPTFATITNVDQLRNQEFFRQAQNGDRILLYRKNKRAFLYRPSTKLVIAKATLGEPNAVPTPSVAVSTQSAAPVEVSTQPNPTIIPHGKILVQPNF